MKSFWVIERRDRGYTEYQRMTSIDVEWTPDIEKAQKFYDRASAEMTCDEPPVTFEIYVTEHQGA